MRKDVRGHRARKGRSVTFFQANAGLPKVYTILNEKLGELRQAYESKVVPAVGTGGRQTTINQKGSPQRKAKNRKNHPGSEKKHSRTETSTALIERVAPIRGQ